jgi:hypothetical protein
MIIIIIFWILASLAMMSQIAPACSQISNENKIIVGIIIVIGGPIMLISSFLTLILDYFLPEGWDDLDKY